MRKYLSLKTMTIISAVVAEKLSTMTPGDELRALYSADTELTEAIVAAQQDPTPAEPRKSKKRGRKGATPAAVNDQQPVV